MTLKRYNIIVYFIILSNLVINVIIAQKNIQNTLLPSSTSSTKPSQTLIPGETSESATESCLKSVACINANDTIKLCNGILKTPDEYIKENKRSGIYQPEDRGLARCMCNQPYYTALSTCIECFNNATKTEFNVAPLENYQEECKKVGTTFTETMPEKIPSSIPPKLKWGVIAGVIVVILIVVGTIIFKYYKRKNAKDKISAEGAGNLSTSDSHKYPPPPPTSYNQYSQYTPPPSDTYYPPPPGGQGGQYPPPQGSQYPPPQGSYPPPQQRGVESGQDIQYPPPQHGGQGGQSDSYYDGNY